jgi:ribonuclease VapC
LKIEFLLGSSAVLAVLNQETGGESVAPLLPAAAISAVNVVEVITRLIQKGGGLAQAKLAFEKLEVPVIPLDIIDAMNAAALITQTKAHGLSLGDRVCLATARRLCIPVVTADREWKKVHAGVTVRCIR